MEKPNQLASANSRRIPTVELNVRPKSHIKQIPHHEKIHPTPNRGQHFVSGRLLHRSPCHYLGISDGA